MAKDKEDEIEEIEDDLEEDQVENEGKEEKDPPEEEEKPEEQAPSEEDTDPDSGGEEGSKEEVSAERQAIRERRRREKKMKREREQREKEELKNLVRHLSSKVQTLEQATGGINKKFEQESIEKIDNEIKELNSVYSQAQRVMEDAIADSDGKKFSQAKSISDKAFSRFNDLKLAKQQLTQKLQQQETQQPQAEETRPAVSVPALSENAVRYGRAFMDANKDWYDPKGSNRESKLVLTIDADLYQEGYDPDSKEYWDELKDRAAEILPHRFKAQNNKPKKTPSIVGGSGREGAPSSSQERTLPKEFVNALKEAGYWDDPEKKKAAIKDYYSSKRKA